MKLLETYHIPIPPALKIKKAWIITFLGVIILRLLLDWSYSFVISDVFGYYNFDYDPTVKSYLLSWFLLLILLPFIVKTIHDDCLSSNILSVLVLISLIPTTTLIGFYGSYSLTYVLYMFVYWAALLIYNSRFPAIQISKKSVKNSSTLFYSVAILLSSVVVYASWKFTGFRFHFGLIDVYDIRAEAREYEFPIVLGYLITAADTILPIILIFFLVRKKWLLSGVFIIIILLNFGISAVKMVLFYLIFTIACYLFIRSTKVFKNSVWFVIPLVVLCIFEYAILQTAVLSNFSLFRIFFIPSKLHYLYFEYFSVRELDYFRQGALRLFFDSPYEENIQFILGEYDIGDFTARANNGLFTDAFLNLGLLGVLLFPFFLTILLKTLEGSARGLDPRFMFVITTTVSFVLLGVSITTSLLTSGLFLLILLLYLMPRRSPHTFNSI
ncbi:MAG: hypothetical protein ACI8Q1_000463 [Parvicella sp.]